MIYIYFQLLSRYFAYLCFYFTREYICMSVLVKKLLTKNYLDRILFSIEPSKCSVHKLLLLN